MRVFLTGATGFLGSHVVEFLLRDATEVAILMRPESDPWRLGGPRSQVRVVHGDLSDSSAWAAALARFAPDVFLHLGWHGVGNAHRNDERQIDANVLASVATARLAKQVGCRAWVGLGSQAEYGPQSQTISESASTNPTTVYGAAKLAACHLCRATLASSNVRFAWLRLFSSYGPKDHPEWMIPYLINTLMAGRKPSLTACEQLWDYLYVADAAEAVARVARCEEAQGVFNLGSGRAVPLRSIVETVRDLVAPEMPLGFGEVPYRPDQVMHLEADVSRLHRLTGWNARTVLAEGMQRTVEWFRDNASRREIAA